MPKRQMSKFKKVVVAAGLSATTTAWLAAAVLIAPTALAAYVDGDLLKDASTSNIYVMNNGMKAWVRSAAVFNDCSYDWAKIKTVSNLSATPTADLIKSAANPDVYRLEKNFKRKLSSIEIFQSYGLSPNKVAVVCQHVLDSYSIAPLIQQTGSPDIYWVQTDTLKHKMTSWQSFVDHGFNINDVIGINSMEMGSYSEGAAIITTTTQKISPCTSYGDVDGNGYVETADSDLVLQIGAGTIQPTDYQKKYGDVSGDGVVGAYDSTLIQYYVTGIISTFPACSNVSCVANGSSEPLIFDAETNLCMERPVFDFFQNEFRMFVHTCDNCINLPQPIISLSKDEGAQPAPLEFYFNNKKLLDWFLPTFPMDQFSVFNIIDNPGNVYNSSSRKVSGTNSITFLVSSSGRELENRYEKLMPNQTTSIKYNIVKKTGKWGSAYFFVLNNSNIDMNGAINTFDSIAEKESSLAGLSNPDPYYVMVWPHPIGVNLGGEGNIYFGDHIVSVGYGGEKYYDQVPTVFAQEISHEYAHNLKDTMHPTYIVGLSGFLTEGMAEAVAIFSGFKTWSDVSFGDHLAPGCSNYSGSHALGRCLFKHLDQDGYLTVSFFHNFFNPNPNDDYVGLYSCTNKFTEPDCVRDITKLLTFLTGKDITSFIQKELQSSSANICTADVEQCPDGSYVGRGGPNCEFAQCPIIRDKSITVVSPNGGEIWATGWSYVINWQVNGLSSTSELKVSFCTNEEVPTCLSEPINDGALLPVTQTSLAWSIPATLFNMTGISANDKFRIKVSEVLADGSTGLWDISDGGFNINTLSLIAQLQAQIRELQTQLDNTTSLSLIIQLQEQIQALQMVLAKIDAGQ